MVGHIDFRRYSRHYNHNLVPAGKMEVKGDLVVIYGWKLEI